MRGWWRRGRLGLGRLLGGLLDGEINWETVVMMMMCYEVMCYDTVCLGGSFYFNTTAVELLSMLFGWVI